MAKCLNKKILAGILALSLTASTSAYLSPIALADMPVNIIGDVVTSDGEFIFEDTEHMSNEEFFGKWNPLTGEWDIAPKINYSLNEYDKTASDLLVEAEDAVKDGDYDTTKEKILEYYRYIDKLLPSSYSGNGTKSHLATCEIYANNWLFDHMAGVTVVDVVEVEQDWSDISVDVTGHVNELKTSGITIDLFDLVKDNTAIEIASREAANGVSFAPYIEVIMNGGIKKTYTTECDTYVVAGTENDTIHGQEERLYCEESISSMWKTGERELPIAERTQQSMSAPVDENTKRSKIAFAFDCADTDSIESATLHLYAKTKEADSTDGGEASPTARMAVFRQASTAWTEANCNYRKVSGYYYSWSGEDWVSWRPLNEGSYRFNEDRHRFQAEGALAKAYEATGDETYAYHFFKYLMSQLYFFGGLPGAYKSLDNAVRLQLYPSALRKMLNSDYMTPTIMANCLKYLWIQMDYQNSKPANTNNWGATEMSGLYVCGINFKELIPREGNEPYMKYAVEQLAITAGHTLLPYGGSNELSMHYTMYALGGLFSPWGTAQNFGVTNPDDAGYTAEVRETLRGLARYYGLISAPGPQTNGHADEHRGGWQGDSLFKIGKMTDDDELIFFGTSGVSGKAPEQTSLYFKDNMNGAMRTGWGKQDLYAHFNVDGAVGSHGQQDDLALIIYAYGQCLLADVEYISDSGDMNDWLVSATGHNTVTIDNAVQDMYKNRGTIEQWETNESYDYLDMQTPNMLTADASRKVLFIKPGFWIVTDYLLPEDMSVEHRYDQRWHLMKDSGATYDENSFAVKSNYASGVNISIVPTNTENIMYNPEIDITEDNNRDGKVDFMDIPVLESDNYDTILKHGYIVTSENAAVPFDNIYAAYTRKNTGATSFSTILYPTRAGQNVDITTIPIKTNVSEADAQAFSATLNDSNTGGNRTLTYYCLNNNLKKENRQVGNYYTDSNLMYVEKYDDGDLSRVILRDVNSLKEGDKYLFKTNGEAVEDISIEFSSGDARIYSSDVLDLNGFTFYADNGITNVYLNDELVSYNRNGMYIYFGETPIVNDNTVIVNPGKPSISVGTGGNVVTGGKVTDKTTNEKPVEPEPDEPDTDTPIADDEAWKKFENEVVGHWAEEELKYLINNNIVTGDGDSLKLDSDVTRAEFAAMIARALDLNAKDDSSYFADVNEEDWFAPYVNALAERNIISGDGNSFYPNRNISREEMAKILVLAYENENGEIDTDSEVEFSDENDMSDWALEYFDKASSIGLIMGDDNNNSRPKDKARRDEAMTVIYRIYKGVKDSEDK